MFRIVELEESLIDKHVDFSDKWIESRFNSTVKNYKAALDKFDINGAHKIIYSFIWNDFCDWYLEMSKNRIYSDDKEVKASVLTRSIKLFEGMMKLLHPMMPYLTEEIWQLLDERKEGESISISKFPEPEESKIDKTAEEEIEFMQSVVTAIRNIRGEMNIPPSKQIDVYLKAGKITDVQKRYIQSLVRVENLFVDANLDKPKASASSVVKGCDVYIPLEGLIDLEVERQRLEKEINRLEGLLTGVGKKLSNEKFVNNAPAEVVDKEKAKQYDWTEQVDKLKKILDDLK
ncbi:MAG: class I tRNA ligase family protein [Melioribacteraceae bacterium]|nr:class I tRNA ligase family protein [Melioribacteraceae bacterium]